MKIGHLHELGVKPFPTHRSSRWALSERKAIGTNFISVSVTLGVRGAN